MKIYYPLLFCIIVIRDANVVQLDVDSEVNHVVGPLNPRAIDHREPVFVGGAPGKINYYHFIFKS